MLMRKDVLRPFIFYRVLLIGELLVLLSQADEGSAHELRGFVALENRTYFNKPIYPDQRNHQFSFVAAPQYYHSFPDDSLFSFIPFFRGDSVDSRRTHFDLRELIFVYPKDFWQLRVGVGTVFWGITETQHLVDIVNQTDAVEDIDGEDKLGQPMLNFSIAPGWGSLEFFVLPFFRERSFPGRHGRLRPPIPIDTDETRYESSAKQWHTDFAIRYFHTVGKLDFGVSQFVGTGREPTIRFRLDPEGRPKLIPYYEQISQTGLEASYVTGSWIWKLEAIYRKNQSPKDFFAWTVGTEYTFSGVAGTGMDLGLLSEWSYDTREAMATTPLQNDLAVGLRLGLNDVEGTELLFAFAQDVEIHSQFFFLEASTLLSEHWRLTADLRMFFSGDTEDPLFAIRRDDFARIALAYHF